MYNQREKERIANMTVKEFYEKINGDYNDAMERFQMEALIAKIVVKFADDDSMPNLKKAVADGDIEASFRAAHTLKGVAGNLSFTALLNEAEKLTNQLRPCTEPANTELLAAVYEQYDIVIEALKELEG